MKRYKQCPKCRIYLTPATEWMFGIYKGKSKTYCRICTREQNILSKGSAQHFEERFKKHYAYAKRQGLIPPDLTSQELEQIIEFYLNCPLDHIVMSPENSEFRLTSFKYVSIEKYYRKKYSPPAQNVSQNHCQPKKLIE